MPSSAQGRCRKIASFPSPSTGGSWWRRSPRLCSPPRPPPPRHALSPPRCPTAVFTPAARTAHPLPAPRPLPRLAPSRPRAFRLPHLSRRATTEASPGRRACHRDAATASPPGTPQPPPRPWWPPRPLVPTVATVPGPRGMAAQPRYHATTRPRNRATTRLRGHDAPPCPGPRDNPGTRPWPLLRSHRAPPGTTPHRAPPLTTHRGAPHPAARRAPPCSTRTHRLTAYTPHALRTTPPMIASRPSPRRRPPSAAARCSPSCQRRVARTPPARGCAADAPPS